MLVNKLTEVNDFVGNVSLLRITPVFVSFIVTVQRLQYRPHLQEERNEGNALFNNALETFYLWVYGIRCMVKEHSDSKRGNPLLSVQGLLFVNSKGSFIFFTSELTVLHLTVLHPS